MKKDFIPILLIIFFSILIALPLTKPGLYRIHDDQQIARLFVFDQALKSGQFPVRWVDSLGFGYGYPLFVFYPPLVYALGDVFYNLGFSLISSVKLVFFVSVFASGVAMYVFSREFFGKLPSLVSATFYMAVPYRALDIYVRGALAESFSFVWLPLILWSFFKLIHTQKVMYLYLSAILLAILMITHNLVFLPFMLILPFYLLFILLRSDNDARVIIFNPKLLARRSLGVVGSIVLSLCLSAFFWLPALLEKKFTIVDDLLLVNLANYKIHFVYPQQLWNWTWGFGGSAAGLADGISFKIGKLHVLLSTTAFLLAVIHLAKKKAAKGIMSNVNCQMSIVVFFLFLLSAFMTTFYSQPIWNIAKPLAYLQFPWRFLIFTTLFSSFLAGSFFHLLKLPILRLSGSLIAAILLLTVNLKLFKPQSYRLDLTDKTATSKEAISWYVSSSSFEYLPKGVELTKSSLGTNVVKVTKDDIPSKKIEVIDGKAEISNLKVNPSRIEFTSKSDSDSKIKANLFNFPGWVTTIGGTKVKIDDNNRLKLVTFEVPRGSHDIKLEFKNTPIRTVANAITMGTIIIMVGMFTFRPKWRKSSNDEPVSKPPFLSFRT